MDISERFQCPDCTTSFKQIQGLNRHIRTRHMSNPPKFTCPICFSNFNRRDTRDRHQSTVHRNNEQKVINKPEEEQNTSAIEKRKRRSSSSPEASPIKKGKKPQEMSHLPLSDPVFPPSIQELTTSGYIPDSITAIRKSWGLVRTLYRKGKVTSTYQIRLQNGNINLEEIENILLGVYANESNCFKMQLSFSVLLFKEKTNEYRVQYPTNPKQKFFPQPIVITKQSDIENCSKRLQEDDIRAHLLQNRDDTTWKLAGVLDIIVNTYSLGIAHPLLGGPSELPLYIRTNHWVRTLHKSPKTGEPYKDNLCCFRAIAWHMKKSKNIQRLAKQLAETFRYHAKVTRDWDGSVTLDQMFLIEQIFSCKIYIYQLIRKDGKAINENEKSSDLQAKQVYCSKSKNNKFGKIYMDLCKDHLSVILSIEKYARTFVCTNCERVAPTLKKIKQHEKICTNKETKSRARYKGGNFETNQTIFDLLQRHGINIKPEDKYKKYFACWDIETMQHPIDIEDSRQPKNDKLKFKAVNYLVSVAVNSNIPGYNEAYFFPRHTTATELIDRVMQYFYKMQEKMATLKKEELSHIFEQLEVETSEIENKIQQLLESTRDKDDKDFYGRELLTANQFIKQLNDYSEKLTLYTFNGARFDNKVCRYYIVKSVNKWEKDVKISTLKRHGGYNIISTNKLDFRDFSRMLPPGTSLDAFLKSQEVEVQKSFFPYEWLDSMDKLEQTSLPPKEAFYSSLTGRGISDIDYEHCQQIFDQKCKNMLEYLADYNKKDVDGFVPAIEKIKVQWEKEAGLCPITDGVSLSALANKLMHKSVSIANPILWIPRKQDKFVFDLFTKAIIGGPSIVFTHRHAANETIIRKNGTKKCQSCIGEDCNSLYLYAIGKDMPIGIPINWELNRETCFFTPKSLLPSFVSMGELEFVLWQQHKTGCRCCRHYLNGGQPSMGPKGKYKPDFICRKTKSIWLYNGCWYHCHRKCNIGRDQKNPEIAKAIIAKDEKVMAFYKRIGYSVYIMWECEWTEIKRNNPQVRAFINERLEMPLNGVRAMSEELLLAHIQRDNIFGVITLDLKVPQSDYDKFKDFPPFFVHRLLTRADLSPSMREKAEEKGLMKRPIKSLVSVMAQKQITVTTPLLKWYLDHGIEASNVTSFIQFKPAPLFKEFVDTVTKNRKAADADENLKVMGTLWKNAGNSAYGKTLEKRESFITTKFCDLIGTSSEIRSQRFIDAEPLLDPESLDPEQVTDQWEVTLEKKSYNETIPKQLGVFILGYGKLRILEFNYDYLDYYFPRDCFEMISMDTDSAYYAIAAPSREEFFKLVKPELASEFEIAKNKFLATKETQREPGLFKIEWTGPELIALAAKSYGCIDEKGGLDKFSAKGVSRKTNILTTADYRSVYDGGPLKMVENRGFMYKNSTLFTYVLNKIGLNNFYAKRRQDDEDPDKTLPLLDEL